MVYKVGEVAKLARVSVRTLHHYDETGLVKPSERSDSGYRLYTSQDLERLQQVLLYKELGFGLAQIRRLLAVPGFDRRRALLAQRELLAARAARLQAMRDLVDRTLESLEGGVSMTKEEMFEVFGDFDPSEYEEEAKERWGDTDAYRESARRVKSYTKEDWQRFKEESEEIGSSIAALMDEGVAPGDPRAMDAAERARVHIDSWFYPCSHEMHVCLGGMYVADARFRENYEKIRPGMARYLCDAIRGNAARRGPLRQE
ncbi:MAG: MerR family transcriptional regulator [Actinobacteria bacterium]|nr:MAG: MerR family transcriptional regulator [Actinomycetota bacterium]